MAAVTNNVESHYVDGVEHSDVEVDRGSLNGLGAAAVNARSHAKSHTMLTKFAWLRTLLEQELQKRSYQLVKQSEPGKRFSYQFLVSPKFDNATLPWAPFPPPPQDHKFPMWSENNSKMACPSFALPAGGILTGGTCPGADAGQTITPVQQRTARLEGQADGWHLRTEAPGTGVKPQMKEGLSICQSCYATGGNFAYASNQTAEIVRYWWLRKHLQAGNMELLVNVFVDSISNLRWKREFKYKVSENGVKVVKTFYERHPIKPIRLHDSGDFFSQKYAEMWCMVADALAERMPDVVIWAPTRTWAQGGWSEFWARRLPQLRSVQLHGRPNLMVRPSAYNFGDRAPEAFAPGNARGTTSLYVQNSKLPAELKNKTDATKVGLTHGAEDRCDFNCGVYGAEEAACVASKAPDGQVGCRACWIHPELRVQYSAH